MHRLLHATSTQNTVSRTYWTMFEHFGFNVATRTTDDSARRQQEHAGIVCTV